jgi:hypothetical protein
MRAQAKQSKNDGFMVTVNFRNGIFFSCSTKDSKQQQSASIIMHSASTSNNASAFGAAERQHQQKQNNRRRHRGFRAQPVVGAVHDAQEHPDDSFAEAAQQVCCKAALTFV